MSMQRNVLLIFILLFPFLSCTEFFEKDISGKTVILLSPPQGIVIENSNPTFVWEKIKGATDYQLEIVDSSFGYIRKLILDTTIKGNIFTFTMLPGNFEWRVRAKNNGSITEFTTYAFKINATEDLTKQTVSLLSPVDNLITKTNQQVLHWDSVYNASQYRLQIIDLSSSQTIADRIIVKTSDSVTFNNGAFTWKVRAENNTSITPYSSRKITIDTIPPGSPTPNTPSNNATNISLPVSLVWTRDASASSDSLFISSDSSFTMNVTKRYTTNTNDTFSIGNSGQAIYWRLKSFDMAGNSSTFSSTFKFSCQ